MVATIYMYTQIKLETCFNYTSLQVKMFKSAHKVKLRAACIDKQIAGTLNFGHLQFFMIILVPGKNASIPTSLACQFPMNIPYLAVIAPCMSRISVTVRSSLWRNHNTFNVAVFVPINNIN